MTATRSSVIALGEDRAVAARGGERVADRQQEGNRGRRDRGAAEREAAPQQLAALALELRDLRAVGVAVGDDDPRHDGSTRPVTKASGAGSMPSASRSTARCSASLVMIADAVARSSPCVSLGSASM